MPRLADMENGSASLVDLEVLGEIHLSCIGEANGERPCARLRRDLAPQTLSWFLPQSFGIEADDPAIIQAKAERPTRIDDDAESSQGCVGDGDVAPFLPDPNDRFAGVRDVEPTQQGRLCPGVVDRLQPPFEDSEPRQGKGHAASQAIEYVCREWCRRRRTWAPLSPGGARVLLSPGGTRVPLSPGGA